MFFWQHHHIKVACTLGMTLPRNKASGNCNYIVNATKCTIISRCVKFLIIRMRSKRRPSSHAIMLSNWCLVFIYMIVHNSKLASLTVNCCQSRWYHCTGMIRISFNEAGVSIDAVVDYKWACVGVVSRQIGLRMQRVARLFRSEIMPCSSRQIHQEVAATLWWRPKQRKCSKRRW